MPAFDTEMCCLRDAFEKRCFRGGHPDLSAPFQSGE